MKTKVVLVAGAIFYVLGLGGCGPKLAPLYPMPSLPAAKQQLVKADLDIKNESSKLEDSYAQLKSHVIKPNSSVVINVPSRTDEVKSEQIEKHQEFKTKGFYDAAEQQIEKVLINNGFRLLSRSKFEAKLRTLRDESSCDINEYNCLYSRIDPEFKPVLEDLKKRYEKKELSSLEYAEEYKEFKEKFQTSSAGRTRNGNDKELTDISEVIRAAESGDVRADYILQINEMKLNQRGVETIKLQESSEIRQFIRENPRIRAEFENGNDTINCAITISSLNAKLVHVKTGEIVWIGEHRLNALSVADENIAVELGSRKSVSNGGEIRSFIERENTPWARERRYGKMVEIPSIKYGYDLVKPTVISGRCEKSWTENQDVALKLAREVAKQLISKIKVSKY